MIKTFITADVSNQTENYPKLWRGNPSGVIYVERGPGENLMVIHNPKGYGVPIFRTIKRRDEYETREFTPFYGTVAITSAL